MQIKRTRESCCLKKENINFQCSVREENKDVGHIFTIGDEWTEDTFPFLKFEDWKKPMLWANLIVGLTIRNSFKWYEI